MCEQSQSEGQRPAIVQGVDDTYPGVDETKTRLLLPNGIYVALHRCWRTGCLCEVRSRDLASVRIERQSSHKCLHLRVIKSQLNGLLIQSPLSLITPVTATTVSGLWRTKILEEIEFPNQSRAHSFAMIDVFLPLKSLSVRFLKIFVLYFFDNNLFGDVFNSLFERRIFVQNNCSPKWMQWLFNFLCSLSLNCLNRCVCVRGNKYRLR